MGQPLARNSDQDADRIGGTARFGPAIAKVRIPLMRPLLPTAESLVPYLQQIDAARYYTNFGPLLDRFETRLAQHFSVEPSHIVCLSSGTAGLVLALRSFDIPPGARCAMPSWTFSATAGAACAVGLTPWFLDVDPATWALDPGHVAARVAASEEPVGAVLVVAPFGGTIDTAAWDRFSQEQRIPVVIDAAASFDAVAVGTSPVMVSLHATKALGIGEGGLVASTDPERITRIRRDSNFGFSGAGRVTTAGTNAKLSEYAAAVGLAALDNWPARRADYVLLSERYRRGLSKLNSVDWAPGIRQGHVSSTLNIDIGRPAAKVVLAQLAEQGIEARRWWSDGCSNQPAFTDCPADPLPVSQRLAGSVIGLPFYLDLSEAEIDEVCTALMAGLAAPSA